MDMRRLVLRTGNPYKGDEPDDWYCPITSGPTFRLWATAAHFDTDIRWRCVIGCARNGGWLVSVKQRLTNTHHIAHDAFSRRQVDGKMRSALRVVRHARRMEL